METKFTEQESLAVINEMINRARNNVQKGRGNSMIFWGIVIASIAILNFILIYVLENPNLSFHAWWLVIPCWIIDYLFDKKRDKEAIVKTHIDNIIVVVWQGFGISYLLFVMIIFILAIALKLPPFFCLITPVIMLMTGLGAFVTAKVCRFKPLVYSAVYMWTGALACIILTAYLHSVHYQFIVLAVCMSVSFVIPGIMINNKVKKNV